ncbi:MAG: SGNH/GDSL hydrolase family protein [Wenzhouxiangella sp.]
MTALKHRLAATLSLALTPIALLQGLPLKRRSTRLPEAAGERYGEIVGQGTSLRLLAVGESPLAGVGLSHPGETVARQLALRIAQASGRPTHWRILARGGYTARAVRERLVPQLDAGPADLILIGLGVNDSIRLRSARRWQAELGALIQALQARTGAAPILLAGVPDMRHFPVLPWSLRQLFGSRSRLLDQAAGELAAALPQTRYVTMELDARSSELFCADGFHPNANGHALWAEQLAPAALQLLGLADQQLDVDDILPANEQASSS